jgi:hypothetical protein
MYSTKYLLTPELIQKFNTSFNLELNKDCKDFNIFIYVYENQQQFEQLNDLELIEIIKFLSYYDRKAFVDYCHYIYDKYLISDYIKGSFIPDKYINDFIFKYDLKCKTDFEIYFFKDCLKYRNCLRLNKPPEKNYEIIYDKYIKPEDERELNEEIEKNKDKIRITIYVKGFCKYDDKYTETIEKNELWNELFKSAVKHVIYSDRNTKEETNQETKLIVSFM